MSRVIGWLKSLRERAGERDPAAHALALHEAAASRLAACAWPAVVLDVLARLRAGGGRAVLVGGTVRDVLLGRDPSGAWDVATDLEPAEVTRRFARVEPVGIRHGTVLVLEGGLEFECTTFRREGGYADARRPDHVSFTHDPLADLARRDLTVNAMAWDPEALELLDPHGGMSDLSHGVLRAVGDPVERFREDALRPLRVARFAATLGMDPDPATRAALGAVRDRAEKIAWERVGQELGRLVLGARAGAGLELLREAGLLALWLPELDATWGVLQNRWHAYDVWEHSVRACEAAPAEKPRVRWAALLHDVGKPGTRVIRAGDATFYGHEILGAELADRALERLRLPSGERAAIVHLVREHMFGYASDWSDGALRRWLRRVGLDAVADLFDLRIADNQANGLKTGFPHYLEEMRARIERLIAEAQALRVSDLAVDGRDVMRALGIGPGPAVGEALEELLERVLDDPARNTRERLLEALAMRHAGKGPAGAQP